MEKKEKLLKIHQVISKNLVELYRVCLADQDGYVPSAPFHYQVSDILLKDTRHFAIEMFRESAKTSMVLKAYPINCLTYPQDSNRYIVIIKQNTTLAEAKLLEIISEYENNDVLNINLIKTHKRSGQAYEVTVRGKGHKNVHMRIEAYGKGASVRGLTWNNIRPQVMILDDIQDLADATSEVTLEKDWNWFLSDVKFLSKTGRIFIIGNNLGKKCVIERIIDSGELGFEILKIPAIVDGESIWKEKFSTEYLLREKEEFTKLGKLDIWYRERMCEAISPETQLFKPEYFKFYEESSLPETFDIDITIDPAISKRKEACNSSIVAVAKNDIKPDWYILDYKFGKWNPYELINNTFEMFQELKRLYPNAFIRVWVEGVAYQEALKYVFEEEMRRRSIFMFLNTFIDKSEKNPRISGLVSMFKLGIIHMRSWMIHLQEELLLFPMGKTVDIADALSFHQHIKINTSQAPVAEEKPKMVGMDGNLHGLIQKLQETDNSTSTFEDTYL